MPSYMAMGGFNFWGTLIGLANQKVALLFAFIHFQTAGQQKDQVGPARLLSEPLSLYLNVFVYVRENVQH